MTVANHECYADLLAPFSLTGTERGPWLVVGRSPLTQGWKLHLSSIPIQASALVTAVTPLLARERTSFKLARTPFVLGQLNEGDLGATQIGKFITVYPESDERARQLALALVELTQGFEGPRVVTDLWLGGIVYARYGGHNPVIVGDRLGLMRPALRLPDGSLRPDSYSVPFQSPEGVANPFAGMMKSLPSTPLINDEQGRSVEPKSSKLFGPGYLMLDVLKGHPKGSVFRGIDLRSQDAVAIKVIKQGRRHCLSDELGRDMRSRLRRQQTLHQRFQTYAPVPAADPYFEVDGDGYLPLEYIEGRSIETVAVGMLRGARWISVPTGARQRMFGYLDKLIQAVARLHKVGFAHRDLTASNVWIADDGEVWLLDLELAHAIEDSSSPFGRGTPGFMSPQQQRCEPPSFADDVYALGCVVVLAFTGIDPRRILFGTEANRVEQLDELTGGAPRVLLEATARALLPDASARPQIADIQCALDAARAAPSGPRVYRRRPAGDMIACAVAGVLDATPCDATSGMWLSPSLQSPNHQGAGAGTLEIRRSANRGVSGVVYLLSRASRLGYSSPGLSDRVQRAVSWLLDEHQSPDTGLPGLHFGEAGVAVAIAEAIAASLTPRTPEAITFISRALAGPLDWPDITHGAAGQGVAAIACADLLGEPALAAHAHACAEYLVREQCENGSWKMPAGVEGMSGQTLTGFAHGVAGMVCFLSQYDCRFHSAPVQRAWQAGTEWLVRHSIPARRGSLEWAYSDTQPAHWHWWCHGGPGIALAFLRVYEYTRDERFAGLARRALRVHPVHLRYPNLTQCHGLSGLGEIYLEASRVFGERAWFERASEIAHILSSLARQERGGALVWLAEDPNVASADLMVGSAGIVHLLLRLQHNGRAPSFPLLCDTLPSK